MKELLALLDPGQRAHHGDGMPRPAHLEAHHGIVGLGIGKGEALDRALESHLVEAQRVVEVDLVEAGIVDPTKVVRTALENAVSVASVLLLTEATMTEIPEPQKERSMEPEMAM